MLNLIDAREADGRRFSINLERIKMAKGYPTSKVIFRRKYLTDFASKYRDWLEGGGGRRGRRYQDKIKRFGLDENFAFTEKLTFHHLISMSRIQTSSFSSFSFDVKNLFFSVLEDNNLSNLDQN